MAISRSDMERQLRKDGGILTLDDARKMAPPGEDLAYINKDEAALLKSLGGAGEDINGTGIKSYFFKKVFRKAKKAVKKVVKSPLGKAAILGALTFGIPGTQFGGFMGKGALGGLKGKLFGTAGKFLGPASKGFMSPGTSGILGKLGLTKGGGSLGLTGLGKIAGITGLSGLAGLAAAGEQDEEDEIDFDKLDRGEGLDIDRIVRLARQNDSQFRFLPGAQFTDSYAEGGEVNKKMAMIKDMLIRGADDDLIKTMTGATQEEVNSVKTAQAEGKAEGGIMNPMTTMLGLSLLDKGSEMGMKEMEKQKKLMELLQKLRMTDPDKELRKRGELEELRRIEAEKRIDKAEGGIMNLGGNEMDLRGGGFVPIGAKEKADDVPARLSKNEFVMTADAVRAAGGGSVDKGADKMYKMMKNLEAQV
jgi:hypothetical protein